ncbi:hypothetical protein BH23PAT1_BH23PAT1_2220 [soil metagenome]
MRRSEPDPNPLITGKTLAAREFSAVLRPKAYLNDTVLVGKAVKNPGPGVLADQGVRVRFLVILTLSLTAIFLCTPVVISAATSTLWLPILPKDCVFDIVQDGTNEVIYLTPIECGQLIEDDENIRLPDGTKLQRPPADSTPIPFIIRSSGDMADPEDKVSDPDQDRTDRGPLSHPYSDETGQDTDKQGNPIILFMMAGLVLFGAVLLAWHGLTYLKRKKRKMHG